LIGAASHAPFGGDLGDDYGSRIRGETVSAFAFCSKVTRPGRAAPGAQIGRRGPKLDRRNSVEAAAAVKSAICDTNAR